MVSEEAFLHQLEQIQNIIDRQASNSFQIKGWSVTLIVAVLLFRTKDIHLAVAFIPLIGFWYLDSYYLRQEKKFRKLYDRIAKSRPDREEELFQMDTSEVEDEVEEIRELAFSKSIRWFYGTIVGLLIVYSLIVLSNGMGWIHG